MKRRVFSLVIALALCLNLCPTWAFAATTQTIDLTEDRSYSTPYQVPGPMIIKTNGHTFTGTGSGSRSTAIQVVSGGSLELQGTVVSQNGTGVEVQAGGTLRVTDGSTGITGATYAIDIASGADVQLSAGTYSGTTAAIRTADGNYSGLLAEGFAFLDGNGSPILPADAANASTLTVGQCTAHPGRSYTPDAGAASHTWSCPACGASGTESCTFDFNGNASAACREQCGHSIAIAVDESALGDLIYNGADQTANVTLTVSLDGTALAENDYTVNCSTRADVGDITVTVTGVTFNGTFTKTYHIEQDQPGIKWDAVTKELDYAGGAVAAGDLPHITITIKDPNNEDLHPYLRYAYKETGDADFTDGLPADAGTYAVKAYLPESQNYTAAETDPLLTLTIHPISPVAAAPAAAKPVFNRGVQELVTAGGLLPVAAADGLEIQFATEENGTYSTTIPTGTNAGSYTVWYRVTGLTDNYIAPDPNPAEIPGVEILRRHITPVVTLSDYTYLYDGGYHEPAVTVIDNEDGHYVINPLDNEYTVEYVNHRNVSTDANPAQVVVTDSDPNGGNYDLEPVTVEFKITQKTQDSLSIINMPNTFTYGDIFTPDTSGGSDSGSVIWEITSGADVAQVDRDSGQVTITGHGTATLKATKSGGNNYEDATATRTFTAVQKPVTATVTAEDKTYDGYNAATVRAVVASGVLPQDEITITGLTGAFSDENAGADKTVTVDFSGAAISGHNSGHYAVSYSAATVQATIHKAVAQITTAPDAADLTYNGMAQALIDDSVLDVDTAGVLVEYALNEAGPYSVAFPTGTDAGAYTVWYRVQETPNYTGLAPDSINVTIKKKPVAPAITLDQDTFTYDGTAKEPVVTLTEADGTTMIPAGEYTVAYSNNINYGTATVTATAKADGNYSFTPVTKNFTINQEQAKVITVPKAAGLPLVFSTYAQELVTAGTASGGAMVYSTHGENGPYSADIPTETDAAEYTVHYKVQGDANHSDSDVGSVKVTIAPKTVNNPTIELFDGANPLVSYTYDGTAKTPTVKVLDGSTEIADTEYNPVYADHVDAGKGTVNITDKPGGNYTVTGSATFVISKADIVFNPAPGAATLTYNGAAQELLIPGVASGGTVQYALNSPTASYDDAIPTAINAGSYTVYYKVVGDKNHNDLAVQGPVSVTIQRKELNTPTIELTPDSFRYDGEAHLPAVTVKDGDTVLPAGEYTWACNVSDPTDGGTYTITVSDKDGGNYDLTGVVAPNNAATFTIGKATQEELVIGGKPGSAVYGDTFTLTISGGSGTGAVTWSATGPATMTDGALTITGAGDVNVTAVKAGDGNYQEASAHWTFTAAPKPVTAVVTVSDKPYDGTAAATVASADIDAADLVTLNGTTDTVTIDPASITAVFDTPLAGTDKTVTLDTSRVTATGDAEKYDISYPAAVKASITRKEVTVTAVLSDHDLRMDNSVTPPVYFYAYDGAVKTPAVTVTADSGEVIPAGEYTVLYSNNKNVSTADGKGTVTITSRADGNYAFTNDGMTVTFEIRSATAELTSTPQAKSLTYDGTDQDLVTVGTASGGTVLYSPTGADGSYSGTIPQGRAAGVYTVYYMVKGDANHTDTAPGQVSVTIRPKEITPAITLEQDRYEYNGKAREPAVTVKDGADPIAASEYAVSYRDNVNAGIATVLVSDANGGNYIVNGTASFTITKAAPAVTAPMGKDDLHYTGELQELVTAGVTGHGAVVYSVNGGNYSAAIPAASAVGTYTIDWKVLGDGNHSDTDADTLTVTIDKNTVNNPTINLSSPQFTYNGSQQKPTVTVYDNSGRVIPEHEYTVEITGGNLADVGTYTVTVAAAGSNYVFQGDTTRTFEILPADQEAVSITGTKAQVCYGDVIQLGVTGGTGAGTITWAVTGGSGVSSTGLLTVKDVGGPITVTVTRSRDNYGEVSAAWEFTAAKKPVTAEVAVAAKDWDGTTGVDSTAITAAVKAADLAFTGDSITITGLTGVYDSAAAGTDKTVTLTGGTVDAGASTNADKYDVTIPATATASILPVAAAVEDEPEANSLTYDASQTQALVTAGTATGGILVYSLDGANFTPAIPIARDAGGYTVYYKVQGDGNHTDSETWTVPVTIGKQAVTPRIELTPPSAQYDGSVKRPEVIARDGGSNVIPAGEYTVVYDPGTNWKDVGDHKVTVKNVEGGNYEITETDAVFTISATAQDPLVIVNKPGLVHYGDAFTLSATGGSGDGAVEWSSSDDGIAAVDKNGLVTIKGTGQAVITAKKPGGTNYGDAEAAYPLNALKKPVTATVTAEDKVYDGTTDAKIHVTWSGLVGKDAIDTSPLRGTFDSENAGTGKTVTITGDPVSDATAQKYEITVQRTATASILKSDTAARPLTANSRDYDGTAQPLVTGGDAKTRYSDTRDGVYSETAPTGTNAGTYTVWYKQLGDDNHNDSDIRSIPVTIRPKTLTADDLTITLSGNDLQTDTDGTYYYAYDGTEKTPAVTIKYGSAVIPAGEYTVTYSNNKNVTTADKMAAVTITDNEGGNYAVSGSATFEIRAGGAQLASSPQARDLTYTGQEQELVTVGAATGGHLEYKLSTEADSEFGTDIPTGIEAKTYTVDYRVVGDDNHTGGPTGSVMVTIKPKEVISPEITVGGSYTYDGTPQIPAADAITIKDGGIPIPASEYTLSCRDNINAGTATVIVTDKNGGNYTVNGTAAFEIAKAAATVGAAPTGKTGLKYSGAAQELLDTLGTATGGAMVYALARDGVYSAALPTGKEVNPYTVWYKVLGDGNHSDSAPASVSASIVINDVTNPTIQVEPACVKYTGEKQEPTITVKDDNGLLIDGSEYTVTYTDAGGNTVTSLIDVGAYTVTVTGKDTNYSFSKTATFTITQADQTALTITGAWERVCYGDTIQLSATGGNGTVTWKVDNSSAASIDENTGLLKITGVGSVTVTATSTKTGYADQTATWAFYADKKPVTAIVTAAAKTYDGDPDADVTATLQASDFVGADSFTIELAGCTFEDANAGTDKKVNVVGTSPAFTVSAGGTNCYENYAITYPGAAAASIFKADIDTTDPTKVTPPEKADGLKYTGLPLPLVTEGSSPDGAMEYSLDGKTYSAGLPTAVEAGKYDVWYRVKGDGNHNDTDGIKLTDKVTIAPQEVTAPTIEFDPTGASYDGKEHKPAITVKDNNSRVIPAEEYAVTYGAGDWTKAGEYEVTITGKDSGNYTLTETKKTFTIQVAGQTPLSITNKPGKVQYGDSFTLSAVGGSGTGAVSWSITDNGVAQISGNGLVTVLKSGSATVTATKQADGGYGATTDTWSFSAEKKPVTAIVTARDREYDTTDTATLAIAWKDGDLVGSDTITLNLTGKFDTADAGTGKTVTITGTAPNDDRYAITIPKTTTASITPKAAAVSGATPTTLTYTGSPIELVTGVMAENGTLVYSTDGSYYTQLVPKGTDAGAYPVWYKAQGSGNYRDSDPVRLNVTIQPKTPENLVIELSPDTFEYDGTAKKPDVVVKDGNVVIPAGEYTVSYRNNTAVGAATVTISDNSGGNYTVSGSAAFEITAGVPTLTAEPQPRELTYTGSAQALVTAGTAVNGKLVYSLEEDGTYSASIPRKTDAKEYEVWYKVQGDNGAGETQAQFVTVTIQPKEVTPTILLNGQYAFSATYTGSPIAPTVTVNVGGEAASSFTPTYSNNTKVGTATVTVQSTGGNYKFFGVTTFEITKAPAEFLAEPAAKTLEYSGDPQELVEFGLAKPNSLLVVYSTDGSTYLPVIPTATDRGSYLVIAKVQGNEMYEDSDPVILRSKIDRNQVQNPAVTLSANSMNYTGSELKPTVTVIDKDVTIPANEYTVSYSDNVNVGEATVTVTGNTNNYTYFTATAKFQIVDASQPVLTITGKPDHVRYGDTIATLKAEGASGAVTWSVTGGTRSTIDPTTGRLVVKDGGAITVTAASGSLSDSWIFTVEPKPVTAVVTAASKPYDGGSTATLTVTISNGLVPGDSITTNADDGVKATGHFADANAGENKAVVIDGLTIPAEVSAKYDISWPSTTTASITPAPSAVLDTDKPTLAAGTLTYNGGEQALLASGGTAASGNLMYSLDGKDYSYAVPMGTDAKTYAVWYKVEAADENHKDSAPVKLGTVTIAPNGDNPRVLCTPSTVQYDGTEKTPAVVVRDSANRIIPESEYTVAFDPGTRIAVGKYKVTVTDKPDGNYEFTSPVTVADAFEIVAASQNPLSIVTDIPTDVHYGDTFRLSATGGSGSGAIQWSVEGNESGTPAAITATGNSCVVTVTGTGGFTVKAHRAGADGYSDSNTDSVPFEAKPKPVTPAVTAADKPYDGKTDAVLTASWKSGDLVGTDTIELTATGAFATADAGVGKRVNVTGHTAVGANADKYAITWPDSTTASIYKVDARLENAPTDPGLTYTGNPQNLVTAGTTVGSIGKVEYSTSQNGAYSETIPTGTGAGKYTVWYKVADSVNYTGIAPASIQVEIKKATPAITTAPTASGTAGQKLSEIKLNGGATNTSGGAFAWENPDTVAEAGKAYSVIFTPDDADNYSTATAEVTAVSAAAGAGGSGSGSGSGSGGTGGSADASTGTSSEPMQTTVRNGTANTVLSAAGGDKLVKEAAANQSQNIVIQPEITGGVTRTAVSIPASTVSRINSETDAALTVASPIADVTIPNAALDTLGSAGGTVDVVTEQVDGAVALSLTAGGETVDSVPGGVTLAVPAEDAGPGTVAVLVNEDGTRETIQKSVVKDGVLNIPLDGSATVEIVDNSKEFDDVPSDDWAADAVAFASAHELFSGTSETTFSPDQEMSRGMLATVLYRLEGLPDQDAAVLFEDVDSDAWYTDGVAWAAENGIVNGYGEGQFRPNDSITREQFAVMLWRYAGSPDPDGQALAFTDADQISGYAAQALRWAVENGIMSGFPDGRLAPGGTATRAQAAQMLKNFMERA